MTLTQLQYLIEVERSGSFSKAAEECFVTQPTLSMQIRELEKELGVIIFRRDKHPIQPTDIGKKIIDQAKQILNDKEKLHVMLQTEKKNYSGKLRIGIIPTVSSSLLPLFLHKFTFRYPDVKLVIDEITTGEIIRYLDEGELDVGIIARRRVPDNYIFKTLYTEPFVVLLHNGHRLERKTGLTPDDIKLDELLLLKEGHCLREQIFEICKDNGNDRNKKIVFESGNLWTIIQLVEKKFGITLLPYLSVKNLPNKLKKQVRKFRAPAPVREIGLLYHNSFIKLHLAGALKNEIQSAVQSELVN